MHMNIKGLVVQWAPREGSKQVKSSCVGGRRSRPGSNHSCFWKALSHIVSTGQYWFPFWSTCRFISYSDIPAVFTTVRIPHRHMLTELQKCATAHVKANSRSAAWAFPCFTLAAAQSQSTWVDSALPGKCLTEVQKRRRRWSELSTESPQEVTHLCYRTRQRLQGQRIKAREKNKNRNKNWWKKERWGRDKESERVRGTLGIC